MKVVLAALNAKYTHSSLALRYLSKAARGFDHEAVEYNINQDLAQIAGDLSRRKPDVLGFSCYIWNIEQVLQITADLRLVNPGLTIVLGGPEVSFDVEFWLEKHPQIDYIVAGEGEEAWPAFLKLWDESRGNPSLEELAAIPGLAFRWGEEIRQNPTRHVDLGSIPEVYDDVTGLENRIVYYETTRGCPFRCAYCLSSVMGPVRKFPLDRCKTELERLAEANCEQIRFVDRTFNFDPGRAFELIEFMIGLDTTTRFQLEVGGDILTPQLLELLTTSPEGRLQFEIGVQSTNPPTLAAVSRGQDLDELAWKVKFLTGNTKVRVLLDLIAGLPEESFDRFGQSFDFAYQLNPHRIHLGFLKLLRGSRLRDEAEQFGCLYSQRAPYEVLQTNHISHAELRHLHIVEDLVERYYNSQRFTKSLGYLTKEFGSPFSFFHDLACRWQERDYHWVSHSLLGLYQILNDLYGESYPLLREYLRWDFRLREPKRPTPTWLGGTPDRSRENELIQSGVIETLVPELKGRPPREMGRRIYVEEFDFGAGRERWLFHFPPGAAKAQVLPLP